MTNPGPISWPDPTWSTPAGWQWPKNRGLIGEKRWPRFDPLWWEAKSLPSLDLNFAISKSLVDQVTGQSLVSFARASTGSYVGSDGLVKTAAANVPRFDHNPTTGESLGLLVEEQRTNLLQWSENAIQWLTPSNVTLTVNQATTPGGFSTANQYIETTTNGLHCQDSYPFSFTTGTTYTYSIFAKSIGGRNFEIGYPSTIFTTRFARFVLSGNGSVQGVDAGIAAGIQAYANGWYRCWASNTCAAGASSRLTNFILNDVYSRSYAGDVTKGLLVWGAQLEAGAFPTSYIPTTTAAVTRAADVAQITGTNFSSWYRQDEGAFYGEATGLGGGGTITVQAAADAAERIQFVNGTGQTAVIASGAAQAIFGSPGTNKQAFAFKTNDFAQKRVGVILETDSSGTLPIVNMATIGRYNFGGQDSLNGTIRRLVYWNQRLPNSTLQAITQ